MTLSAPTNDRHDADLPSPSSDNPDLRRIHSEITYSQIADIDLHMSSTSSKPVDGSATRVISFGPFSLLPDQRQLLEVDKLLNIGSRAFDILLAKPQFMEISGEAAGFCASTCSAMRISILAGSLVRMLITLRMV